MGFIPLAIFAAGLPASKTMNEFNEVESISQLSQVAAEPKTAMPGAIPFVIVPQNHRRESLEDTLPAPLRKKVNLNFDEAESFIRYLSEVKSDRTRVFASVGDCSASFRAVIDFHGNADTEASWCLHNANYACPLTEEWQAWMGGNTRTMAQDQFAYFLEENGSWIVEPSSAEVLEVAKTLQAKKEVDFHSAIRLDNGAVQLKYLETINAKAGEQGAMIIPTQFKLGIAPFVGGSRYAVAARLRYRIAEKSVVFTYELIDPHLVIRDAAKGVMAEIEKATGIKPLMGKM
jgi:uncharacterized protein YfdQ (DUF2303 family)